jgi:hypothetical protein
MNFEENKYILEDIKYKLSTLRLKNKDFEDSILSMISMIESFKDTIIMIESYNNTQNESFNDNITEFINQMYEYTEAMKCLL